ncbi:MAG: hypothetical protein HYT22_02930 [Candidatus Niyogibacteria bacterium]|nr:hypothetical protein [Candidatus Niyogibacteria bacterium]
MKFIASFFIALIGLFSAVPAFAGGDLGGDGNLFNARRIHFKPFGEITRYLMEYLKPDATTDARGGVRMCMGKYNPQTDTAVCYDGTDATKETGAVPGFLMDIQGTLNIGDGQFGLGSSIIRFNPPGLEGQLGISTDGGQTWSAIGGTGAGGSSAAGWVAETPILQPQPSIITTAEGVVNRVGINVSSTYPGLSTLTVKQPNSYVVDNVRLVEGSDKIIPVVQGTTDFFRQVHKGDRVTATFVAIPPIVETKTVLNVSLINDIETITVDSAFSRTADTEITVNPAIFRVEDAAGNVVFGIDGAGTVQGSGWVNNNGVLTTDFGIAVDKDSMFFNKLGVGGSGLFAPLSGTEAHGTLTVRGTLDASAGDANLQTADINGDGIPERFIISTQFNVGDAIGFATSANGPLIHRTMIVFVDASDRAALASAGTLADGGYSVFKDSRLFEVQNGVGVSKLTMDKSGNVGIGTAAPVYTLDVEKNIAGDWVGAFVNTNTTNGYGLRVQGGVGNTGALEIKNAAGANLLYVKGNGNVTVYGALMNANGWGYHPVVEWVNLGEDVYGSYSSGRPTDTCDGNRGAPYVCPTSSNVTCIDSVISAGHRTVTCKRAGVF